MTTDDETLIRILAEGDAAFVPPRTADDWRSPLPGAAWQAREALAAGSGLPFRSSSKDANRMQALRCLERLQAAGLVEVTRTGGRLFPLARLSEAGETRARALAGLPWLGESFDLAAAVRRRRPRRTDGWHAEGDVVRVPKGWTRRAALLEQQLAALPGLRRGWILAASDGEGRVHYRAATLPAARPAWADLPEGEDAAWTAYDGAYVAARRSLREEKGVSDLGAMPLPTTT